MSCRKFIELEKTQYLVTYDANNGYMYVSTNNKDKKEVIVYDGIFKNDFEEEYNLIVSAPVGIFADTSVAMLHVVLVSKKLINPCVDYRGYIEDCLKIGSPVEILNSDSDEGYVYSLHFPLDYERKSFKTITKDIINKIHENELRDVLLKGFALKSESWEHGEFIYYDKNKMQLLDESNESISFDSLHLDDFYDTKLGFKKYSYGNKSYFIDKNGFSYIKAIISHGILCTHEYINTEKQSCVLNQNELEQFIDNDILVNYDGELIDINEYLGEDRCLNIRYNNSNH